MTRIMILNESGGSPQPRYRASSGHLESVGGTPGAALDALAQQLDPMTAGALVVVQNLQPDEFFTAAQRDRLEFLTRKQREAYGEGVPMASTERDELQSLIDAELEGATERAAAMTRGPRP